MLPAERVPSAAGLLEKYWDGYLPVKVALIAERQSIDISESNAMSESGVIERHGDGSVTILLNSSDSGIRKRFTIAHELGHYNLGHLDGGSKMFRDPAAVFNSAAKAPEEIAANDFAAKLLMPANAIQYVLENGLAKDIAELAKLFDVSHLAMGYRMKNLGYRFG